MTAGWVKSITCGVIFSVLIATTAWADGDDFSSDLSLWDNPGALGTAGSGELTITGGALQYTGSGFNDFSSISYKQTLSIQSSWSASVDVTFSSELLSNVNFGKDTNLNLIVSDSTANHTAQVALDINTGTVQWKADGALGATQAATNGITSGTLQLTYDANTSLLVYSYKETNGTLQELDTLDMSSWLADTDSLMLSLAGGSSTNDVEQDYTVASGQAQMDNFQVQVQAAPEPTTLATMAIGLIFIAAALYHRKPVRQS